MMAGGTVSGGTNEREDLEKRGGHDADRKNGGR
jgi:hypothetical protein